MSINNARIALLSEVKATLDGLGYEGKIHWENTTFDPSGSVKWAAVSFQPAQPFVVTLGDTGSDRLVGIVRVDLVVPQGASFGDLYSDIDSFRSAFKAGKGVTYGTTTAVVISCGVNAGLHVDNWHKKSISINFRADITRI